MSPRFASHVTTTIQTSTSTSTSTSRTLRRWMLRLLAVVGRVGGAPARPTTPPRRILVIKPDHLGDVLLATPALHTLRQHHPPPAFVAALAGPWSATMLATNPHIDTLLTLPFPGFVRGGAQHQKPHSRLHPYRLLLSSAALLRAGHFDTALLLRDDHWWGAALTLLAGIPRRVGHAVPECRPFLTTALPWDATEHVTVQALQVVEALHHTQSHRQAEHNRTVPGKIPLTFEPAADERAWAQGWLEQHGVVVRSAGDSMYAVQTSPRLVVLHPGTGGATKLWPVERWGVVGNVLTAECGVQLLLTGGPGEEPLVDTLASMIHPRPLTLVGSARIGQLAALLCLATLVIGVDSGPLHIAVSQRSATIHLYGPSDDRRFGPWGDRTWHSVLRSGLWCRPCHVFQACPRATNPPECMTAITVEHVLHAARTLLNRLPEI